MLEIEVGIPYKILEAYMVEAVWLAESLRAYLATMFWVVVVLLWQHEDQFKRGLLWMVVHI